VVDRAAVEAWGADDVDEAAAGELQALLDAGDQTELDDRFFAPLAFGTAGLRGPLRAGPNGMNPLAQLARGRRNEARARLGDAARLFARFGETLRRIQCHYLLGEVAWMGEDPIRAGSHYRDALAVARPAGEQAWIELLTLRFEHR